LSVFTVTPLALANHSVPHRELGVRGDDRFGQEEAGVVFEEGDRVVRDVELRVAMTQLIAREDFVRQVVSFRGGEGAGDEFAIGPSKVEAAGDVQELLLRFGFELVPECVGAFEQRDVIGVLEIGEADHA
jgi:hypothetical protein